MRPMSSERDIDDILESLNQLLREGESHNDDHVESEAVAGARELDTTTEMVESELQQLDATEEKPSSDGNEAAEISKTLGEPTEQGKAVEVDEDAVEEHAGREDAVESISIQRVVLTEEMLVDNPQGNLLSLVKTSGPEHEEGGNSKTESTGKEISEERIEMVLKQVSADVIADVINQLQNVLPTLIKNSLERHLVLLKQSPDQPEEQNEDE